MMPAFSNSSSSPPPRPQIIAFLGGLHHSGLFRPSLIVCPATVLRQWLRELRAWYPLFRQAHARERSLGCAWLRMSAALLPALWPSLWCVMEQAKPVVNQAGPAGLAGCRVAILHESVRSGATSGARPSKRQLIQDIAQVGLHPVCLKGVLPGRFWRAGTQAMSLQQ